MSTRHCRSKRRARAEDGKVGSYGQPKVDEIDVHESVVDEYEVGKTW